jgi:hypothetical protein
MVGGRRQGVLVGPSQHMHVSDVLLAVGKCDHPSTAVRQGQEGDRWLKCDRDLLLVSLHS